jgi:hypothetical protein
VGPRTRDLGGTATTAQVGDAVVAQLDRQGDAASVNGRPTRPVLV